MEVYNDGFLVATLHDDIGKGRKARQKYIP